LFQPIPRYPYSGMKLLPKQFLGRQLRHISGHSNIRIFSINRGNLNY